MEIIVISVRQFDGSGVGYCVWQLFSLAHPVLAEAQAVSIIMGERSTMPALIDLPE